MIKMEKCKKYKSELVRRTSSEYSHEKFLHIDGNILDSAQIPIIHINRVFNQLILRQ